MCRSRGPIGRWPPELASGILRMGPVPGCAQLRRCPRHLRTGHDGANYRYRRARTERDLVQRAAGGDPSAQRALYDRHVERVYRLTYRIAGDPDLASDLTQDTFIRAFEKLGDFRHESSLGTWLHSIAVSVSLAALRKQKRREKHHVALDDAVGVGKSDDQAVSICGRSCTRRSRSAGWIQDGVRDVRDRGIHACGDRACAGRRSDDVQGSAVPGARKAARCSQALRWGEGGSMIEDMNETNASEERELDALIARYGGDYNRPPDIVPVEEIWAGIPRLAGR